ncbi:hypothetical protein [Spartinivicinus poritis]|uniref:Uncharacterized protein n=1 Tax=Spartinivicinus poritis TaxID=2994640 RepID=A0ABT5UGT9_9GAMM|nr:hypothetical protein [Spartinivicinus sp. A2-2]MDE1465611.1 hypothetical protein [Spartinivicinus sp. A2-2]
MMISSKKLITIFGILVHFTLFIAFYIFFDLSVIDIVIFIWLELYVLLIFVLIGMVISVVIHVFEVLKSGANKIKELVENIWVTFWVTIILLVTPYVIAANAIFKTMLPEELANQNRLVSDMIFVNLLNPNKGLQEALPHVYGSDGYVFWFFLYLLALNFVIYIKAVITKNFDAVSMACSVTLCLESVFFMAFSFVIAQPLLDSFGTVDDNLLPITLLFILSFCVGVIRSYIFEVNLQIDDDSTSQSE